MRRFVHFRYSVDLYSGPKLFAGGPSDTSRWHGIPVRNIYFQAAVYADGTGYINDSDGPLPLCPPELVWGPPEVKANMPRYWSSPLLMRAVSCLGRLGPWTFLLAVLPAAWAAQRARRMVTRRRRVRG